MSAQRAPGKRHLPRLAACTAGRLLEKDYEIRTAQEPLGHKIVETTMIHTHVIPRSGWQFEVRSTYSDIARSECPCAKRAGF